MYRIVITNHFKKQLKRLVKKNRQLKAVFIETLNEFVPSQAISIGKGLFKVRLKGQSKGKSGGYRLYLFVIEVKGILTPICIYAKNEQENISFNELTKHLDRVKHELTGESIENLKMAQNREKLVKKYQKAEESGDSSLII